MQADIKNISQKLFWDCFLYASQRN